jgi:DNA-binding protein H-NS
MAKPNIARMDVAELLDLRDQIEDHLSQRRTHMEKELARLSGGRVVRGGGSKLKGRRVPAKYRDPKTGATWSGRGARAKWLVGKKLSDYLIDKSGTKKRA